jgi:cbb3-type cytochrome oxidase maturation protein
MSVILILLAASLSIAICFLLAFIWSVKNGQYDDDYTPSVRMLFDDAINKDSDSRARDAKGLALFCEGDSQTKKAGAIAEPEAAHPGAQNIKSKSENNNSIARNNKHKTNNK